MSRPSLAERLFARRRVTVTGCWEWTGVLNKSSGYGQISVRDRSKSVHRVAYELWTGPIPDGLEILHACDNKPCFNPAHLSVGTRQDNVRDIVERGRRLQETCGRGHLLTEDNVIRPDAGGTGHRRCKTCRRETQRAWKRQRRLVAS